jgi:ATP-dependent Clp protease adaptor protein ClpS
MMATRRRTVEVAKPMSNQKTTTRRKTSVKTEKPRLYKVILVNDDYTPREFVITVLKGVFHISEEQASRVMLTAHKKGRCVVIVLARDTAETKANEGTEAGRREGFPLQFTTEPEE